MSDVVFTPSSFTTISSPSPASPSPEETSLPQPQAFAFTGSGSEFFRIWIVNLLLSILTLGIYSAWAKVRTAKYFYNNTTVAGANFDYHGNPISILKGRLIALVGLALYYGAAYVSEVLAVIAVVVLALLMPWFIWKGLQFSFYNSSYRSVRFSFAGSTGKTYKVFLLFPVLTVFTFYLAWPFAHHEIKRFMHTEARFGRHSFSFKSCPGDFYLAYLFGMILMMGLVLAFFLLGAIVVFFAYKTMGSMEEVLQILGIPLLIGLGGVYLSMFLIAPVILAKLQNTVWNHTSLGEHTFVSNLPVGKFVWLTLSNFLLIVLTFGLFIPFAKVRLAKLKLSALSLVPGGPLEHFMAGAQQQVGATGEGMADLVGIDVSL
ncbi:MAG: DUF898 domain-containing protein [Burkholderiaceae bacterium]|nr:DUF898 domain-containing protein [Burkholderiaceae bacterium]